MVHSFESTPKPAEPAASTTHSWAASRRQSQPGRR